MQVVAQPGRYLCALNLGNVGDGVPGAPAGLAGTPTSKDDPKYGFPRLRSTTQRGGPLSWRTRVTNSRSMSYTEKLCKYSHPKLSNHNMIKGLYIIK